VTAIPGVALCGTALLLTWGNLSEEGGAVPIGRTALRYADYSLTWLCGVGVAIKIVRQLVALPLFTGLDIRIWGKYKWWLGAIYAAAGLAFL
tara:strand:+ start:8921 stop:9196 length:276 start_codon:yes stop_codon:yes gene_type:complete